MRLPWVIVNLLGPKTYSMTGRPWGVEVPAAPTSPSIGTWAFVVAGQIDNVVTTSVVSGVTKVATTASVAVATTGRSVRVTNHRTGETRVAPTSASGEFLASFVDMTKRDVVAPGDEMTTQLIDPTGFPLTEPQRHILSPNHVAHAYLLTRFSGTPAQNRLLQNYNESVQPGDVDTVPTGVCGVGRDRDL